MAMRCEHWNSEHTHLLTRNISYFAAWYGWPVHRHRHRVCAKRKWDRLEWFNGRHAWCNRLGVTDIIEFWPTTESDGTRVESAHTHTHEHVSLNQNAISHDRRLCKHFRFRLIYSCFISFYRHLSHTKLAQPYIFPCNLFALCSFSILNSFRSLIRSFVSSVLLPIIIILANTHTHAGAKIWKNFRSNFMANGKYYWNMFAIATRIQNEKQRRRTENRFVAGFGSLEEFKTMAFHFG